MTSADRISRSSAAAATAQRRLPRGIAIVYEDDDVLVVDKPTGIITADPAASGAGEAGGGRRSGRAGNTVFDVLKEYVRSAPARRARVGGRARSGNRGSGGGAADKGRDQGVWIIHRLDKEASGLLVFAKNVPAFQWLKEDLRAKRVEREYLALAEGLVAAPGATGTIQSLIEDDESPRPRRNGPPRREQGRDREAEPKPAVLHYQVLAAASARTLLRVRLETGRKNQIRIQFAGHGAGHPLVGDRKFGAKTDAIGRLGLHAVRLSFSHPSNGQPMTFESDAPANFFRAVDLPPPPRAQPEPSESAASAPPAPQATPGPKAGTSWDAVASWYDELLEDRGNDHYAQVIVPGAMRLLEPQPGLRVLDIACGQGILGRRLASLKVESVGVEASPRLIEAAQRRARDERADRLATFRVGDARHLADMQLTGFDAATCIMALANIDPLGPVMSGVASALKPGGRFVWVITHPAFRAHGQSDWGWDAKTHKQYRRVDGYLSAGQREIDMNPGKAARGAAPVKTWTFHRPLQTYIEAMSRAGLLVEKLEEWPSLRESTSGPRAAEENRARREIPLFLGVRAIKR